MYDLPQPPPQHFYCPAIEKSISLLASIIKFPPSGTASETYKDLVCTDQDRANIFELITSLAENQVLILLLKQGAMQSLGAQIHHVHPLKFLETIFTHPRLKSCMSEIFDDYFKRSGFMEGIALALSREADKKKIEPFLNDFGTVVKVPAENMRCFFQARDWEGLVRHLIQS